MNFESKLTNKTNNMRKIILTFLALTISFTFAYSQTKIDIKGAFPVDPNVKVGKLDNGLVYYIRKNSKPEKRIEMRLVVNTGSILESDAQLGLAHFTEHMCFNGTKNFPKNELINYLQAIGIKFGADINAGTGFDETVYMLQIPSDKPELVEKGYQVIEDWAHNVTFDSKEIDKERGVIIEEWRLGLGADDRMMKKFLPVAFKGSKYAERLPIGKKEIIESFKHDTLRKFYQDWYRADLQAVIIVGDIDIVEAEKKIIEHFSKIPKPENARPREEFNLPNNVEPLISIVTDKEATGTEIQLFYKHPKKVLKVIEDYKDILKQRLFSEMLNQRFAEISRKADAPYIYAYAYYGNFLARNLDAFVLGAAIKENMIQKGFEALIAENERVKRFGFVQTELDRIKDDILIDYERKAKEIDKTESEKFTSEYENNYLKGEPIPGLKNELKYAKKFMPEITLEEINKLAKEWVTDENLVVIITAPEKANITIPTDKDILSLLSNVKNANITAWVDNFKPEPLVTDNLVGMGVSKRVDNKEFGFTEITLQNNVQIIIKPTDFKNDEILLSAYSPGGHSLYADSLVMSALFADAIIDESGAGNFDQSELLKKLKGKIVSLSPYISDLKEGFNGSCSPKDFETMLQLTYLYFKYPRKDTSAFNGLISKTVNQFKFVGANPIYAFIDTLIKTSVQNDPRVMVLPKENDLNKINLEQAMKIYKDRFSDCSDFKFFIVGNVNVDSITPLLQKYIGSLPFAKRNETWKNVEHGFPSTTKNIEVKKGTEPKSMVGIILSEPLSWTFEDKIAFRMLEEVINIKLVEVIREEMSGVYSPQTQGSFEKYPDPRYTLMIMFGCSPKNTEKLSKAVFKIIEKIQKKGPTAVDLVKVKELLVREREIDSKTNKFWLNKIESVYYNGENFDNINNYNDLVNAININTLKIAAQKLFKLDHYVKVVLKPEDKK